ncbi:helix-turn-helix domain-containing protein [Acutalibacter sp. 1XD8-33]|uniref:DNA methyltransferase n=1 Tax=Acutalibacter sp. 1XD8-33 TaxID=2320081 RepID=UPI000EA20825|nr:DNA methyltransferase [Acutalibacter sp. 1XD8-33]RKJ38639.1 helix-turn-helix domain-containing protein [Acutalibacter sp. 1XD8-33]
MSENIVGTKQAAEILGVSISTIYRMVDQGILQPFKTPGGQRRFSVSQLEEYQEKSRGIVAPQNPYQMKSTMVSEGIITDSDNVFSETAVVVDSDSETTTDPATDNKPVDPRNSLNDLNGSQWLPETKSFFYQKGLGAKHPHAQIERQHPAPFSFQDISHLVTFFTKKGMEVLDPFGGVGSTAKACELERRICTSIELQKRWHDLAIERLETEVGEGTSKNHTFILGDAREELKKLGNCSFDFMVTSPPYWSILNKKADYKVKKERLANNLATNYSDNDENDLANIENYEEFLRILVDEIFLECGRLLRPKKYMCLVVSDFRNKSEFISFHSDLIQALNHKVTADGYKITLQGVKVLLQNHKTLLPYGYPFAYVENIHHQYILIFRKDKK